MKFILCEPESRKTWDVFGILRRDYPSAKIFILCRNSIEKKITSVFYLRTIPIVADDLQKSSDETLFYTAYAIPIEDWFIDLLQSIPEKMRPRLACLDQANLTICRNKKSLYGHLNAVGIRAPKVYSELEVASLPPGTPLVLKPMVGSGSRGLEFVSAQAGSQMGPNAVQDRFFCERIGKSNQVEGVFILASHGQLVASYVHRRLLTWPKSAGVSVLSEIIEAPDLEAFAREVVAATSFHGLGMIETLSDDHNQPCLIEINTRIWGSFLLSQSLETSLLTNYIYVCNNVEFTTTTRKNYYKFLFPHRAILSAGGLIHLLKSIVSKQYLVSGFYHVPFFRSLLFPFISTIRYFSRYAK